MPGPGAPYPHPDPAPGSSAIGQFQIGVSPIGTIPAFDVWQTVLSQYGNSSRITTMITDFGEANDPTYFLDDFFDNIWNVLTAVGYGLDVWGRIVGVTRIIPIPGDQEYFGFSEAGDAFGFGQAPFFSGSILTENFVLSDAAFRVLILAKAASNISDGSIIAINDILLALFPNRGNCYVTDGGDMTMTYTFEFALTPVENAILQVSGVLPTPAGVAATIVSF